eukprot:COSAG05_NODE_183_length_14758_cov_90.142506_8_plen_146_part_00
MARRQRPALQKNSRQAHLAPKSANSGKPSVAAKYAAGAILLWLSDGPRRRSQIVPALPGRRCAAHCGPAAPRRSTVLVRPGWAAGRCLVLAWPPSRPETSIAVAKTRSKAGSRISACCSRHSAKVNPHLFLFFLTVTVTLYTCRT